jgi:hypothetical protein
MLTLKTVDRNATMTSPELSEQNRYYVEAKVASAAKVRAPATPVKSSTQLTSGPIVAWEKTVRAYSLPCSPTSVVTVMRRYTETGVGFRAAMDLRKRIDLDFVRQNALFGMNIDVSNSTCVEMMYLLAQCVDDVNRASDFECQTSPPAPTLPAVIRAPQWLKDRRKALRRRPPPSLEDVRTYFRASAAFQRKSPEKQHS